MTLKAGAHPGPSVTANYVFERKFVCTRDANHEAFFVFRIEARKLSKIGQSPSAADLCEEDLTSFRKVLDKAHYAELSRAGGW